MKINFFWNLNLSLILLISFACKKRLDSFMFANDNTIESYKLDDYEGSVTLQVGPEYDVANNKIHLVEIPYTDEGGNTQKISGIFTGDLSQIATDSVILYCHGNAKHMDFYWPRQKLYSHLGGLHRFGVFMIDYPGFGLSTGVPTEENMYKSVDVALKWLKQNGLSNDRLIQFGFSLGSAPTCEVASSSIYPLKPSKIILEAPFASSEKLIQDGTGLALPGSYFVSIKVDNAAKIKNVTAPLLWIHGEEDGFLAIDKHGEIVYNNYPLTTKTAIRVPEGDHENTPYVFGYSNYLSAILNFIAN
jgi:pimeloyl-ACP methyl ester carboxylesterase